MFSPFPHSHVHSGHSISDHHRTLTQKVVKNNEIMLCKHQIACRLAERIKKCKYKQVKDDYLINLFKNAEERSSQTR